MAFQPQREPRNLKVLKVFRSNVQSGSGFWSDPNPIFEIRLDLDVVFKIWSDPDSVFKISVDLVWTSKSKTPLKSNFYCSFYWRRFRRRIRIMFFLRVDPDPGKIHPNPKPKYCCFFNSYIISGKLYRVLIKNTPKDLIITGRPHRFLKTTALQ